MGNKAVTKIMRDKQREEAKLKHLKMNSRSYQDEFGITTEPNLPNYFHRNPTSRRGGRRNRNKLSDYDSFILSNQISDIVETKHQYEQQAFQMIVQELIIACLNHHQKREIKYALKQANFNFHLESQDGLQQLEFDKTSLTAICKKNIGRSYVIISIDPTRLNQLYETYLSLN